MRYVRKVEQVKLVKWENSSTYHTLQVSQNKKRRLVACLFCEECSRYFHPLIPWMLSKSTTCFTPIAFLFITIQKNQLKIVLWLREQFCMHWAYAYALGLTYRVGPTPMGPICQRGKGLMWPVHKIHFRNCGPPGLSLAT